jgi:hypothetical protein
VPHWPQNSRWPKLDHAADFTVSAPSVQLKSPSGTLANTIAGAPLFSWHVRQWHQPQSNGSLLSS